MTRRADTLIISPMIATYESYLEQIRQYAIRDGLADIRLAREEFHRLTGEFDEGEPWFELRMTMFHDWYLLDRKNRDGTTPAERFCEDRGRLMESDTRRQFEHLTVTHRSVFRLIKVNSVDLLHDDLVYGGRWLTRWTLPAVGLKVGDMFETRIVMMDDIPTTGRGTVFHPREAHGSVDEIIARAIREKMPRRELVDHLDKMRLKLDRYSNVKIRHVYQYPDDALL